MKKKCLFTEDILQVNENNESLKLWIKCEQRLLKQQDNYSKLNASLKLFTDEEGIVRLKARLQIVRYVITKDIRSYFKVAVLVILRR